jgi:hypothetical protein
MRNSTLIPVLLAAAFCTAACRSNTSTQAETADGGAWIANGVTACETYLTPDVVASIWGDPAGQSQPVDTRSPRSKACVFQSSGHNIKIELNTAGPESFEASRQYLVDPAPLPNVGDKASLTGEGIVAVKGANRTCRIDTVANVGSVKLSREALGQKFGEICNKLFALR